MFSNLLAFLGRMWCGLRGHDLMLDYQVHCLRQTCYSCGYESEGWEIGNRFSIKEPCVCGDSVKVCDCKPSKRKSKDEVKDVPM